MLKLNFTFVANMCLSAIPLGAKEFNHGTILN